MMNYYRAYTMEYGTFIGLCWSAVFLTYAYGVMGNALLLFLCMALCGVSVVLPFILAVRLNKRMHADGAYMSYFQGLLFSFSMLMYACLMHGLVVYGYFEILDNGAWVSTITNMLNDPNMKNMYEQMGMSGQHKQVVDMLGEIGGLGSFDKTLLIFNNDFLVSIVLAAITAIPVSWRRKA